MTNNYTEKELEDLGERLDRCLNSVTEKEKQVEQYKRLAEYYRQHLVVFVCPKCGESRDLTCNRTVGAHVEDNNIGKPISRPSELNTAPIDDHERMTCGSCAYSDEALTFKARK